LAGDGGRAFFLTLLLGGVPAFLIFAEPDWGTAILLGMLTFAMLLLAGARWPHLALTGFGLVSVFTLLLAYNPLRLMRFLIFLNPQAHEQGAGWQIWQGLIAIGSGGWRGHFLDGSIHKYGFVPEQQTDYIFTCVGEETGLIGTTLVLLFYLGVLRCGWHIMKQAGDRFGFFLAGGCTMVILLQAGLNIAVNTSLIPCKGLPLPFMSYGGSGLLAMFICAGLLGSVAWHSRPGRDSSRPR
jgi:cell division protein FtsW